MILEVDDKGAVDLTHNWSVGGRTCQVEVRQYFLRDLMEKMSLLLSGFLASQITAAYSQRTYQALCSKSIWLLTVENDSL
jgi:hypothetical protein